MSDGNGGWRSLLSLDPLTFPSPDCHSFSVFYTTGQELWTGRSTEWRGVRVTKLDGGNERVGEWKRGTGSGGDGMLCSFPLVTSL